VKFLLDESLSPRVAVLLNDADHDERHVRDLGSASATDPVVLQPGWRDAACSPSTGIRCWVPSQGSSQVSRERRRPASENWAGQNLRDR
jgi:hypothetical protein